MADEIIGVKKLKPGWKVESLPDIISPGVAEMMMSENKSLSIQQEEGYKKLVGSTGLVFGILTAYKGVANPNLNVHIDNTSNMKVEDSASVVCQHGKDSTISSKTAAEKIIQEMAPGKLATETEWNERLEKVQNIVKEYRNGLGLEETTKKIIDLLDPMSKPLYELTGILNGITNIKYNHPSSMSPFSGISGGIGSGQIPVNRVHNIGDIVENKNTLQPLPDNTWLWCDAAYVFQDNYPDLYQELQFNTSYNYKWGYIFDEQIEPFTNRTKFNVPLIPLNMIKAL
jgi:hypothetical protein